MTPHPEDDPQREQNLAWDKVSPLCDAERPKNNNSNKKHMLSTLQIQVSSSRLRWPIGDVCWPRSGQEVTWRNVKPALFPSLEVSWGQWHGTGTGTLRPQLHAARLPLEAEHPWRQSTIGGRAPLEAKHPWRQSTLGGRGIPWGGPSQDQAQTGPNSWLGSGDAVTRTVLLQHPPWLCFLQPGTASTPCK